MSVYQAEKSVESTITERNAEEAVLKGLKKITASDVGYGLLTYVPFVAGIHAVKKALQGVTTISNPIDEAYNNKQSRARSAELGGAVVGVGFFIAVCVLNFQFQQGQAASIANAMGINNFSFHGGLSSQLANGIGLVGLCFAFMMASSKVFGLVERSLCEPSIVKGNSGCVSPDRTRLFLQGILATLLGEKIAQKVYMDDDTDSFNPGSNPERTVSNNPAKRTVSVSHSELANLTNNPTPKHKRNDSIASDGDGDCIDADEDYFSDECGGSQKTNNHYLNP